MPQLSPEDPKRGMNADAGIGDEGIDPTEAGTDLEEQRLQTGRAGNIGEILAIDLRRPENAAAFLSAFPKLELADGATLPNLP